MKSAIFKTFFLSLCIVANTHFAYGQTASILPPGYTQYLDNNGKPLTSGKVYNYIPATTIFKTTWQDSGQVTANTNPVILDAGGRAKILGDGVYRQIVKDRNNNIIWDAVTSSTGSGSSSPTSTGDGDLVGTIKPWAGMTAPNQYAFTYGQEISRTTYATLYTAITSTQAAFCNSGSPTLNGLSDTTNFWIGMTLEVSCVAAGFSTVVSKTASSVTMAANANVTTNTNATFFPWGRGNGTTTFNLPDFRGFTIVGNNIMGGVASANISTTYFGSATANSSGAAGGAESIQLDRTNLPTGITSSNASQSITVTLSGGNSFPVQVGGNNWAGTTSATPGAAQSIPYTGGVSATIQGATSITGSNNISVTSNNTGTAGVAVAFSRIQPSKTASYIIKITPDTNSASASGVTSLGGMTGDIACGTGLLCTGNNISVTTVNVTAANVSFTQSGTGADQITLDTILRAKIITPEMFKTSGSTCDGTDDGPAIQEAVTYAGTLNGKGKVELAPCSYKVITPIVDSVGIDIYGTNNLGPQLVFAPSGANQIMYRVRNAGSIVSGGSFRNIGIYTFDTANTKTALEIEDTSQYTIEDVSIRGSTVSGGSSYWGGGSNSIGIKTKGREFTRINRVDINAERPLVIADNPNSTIDSDWGDFRNLTLVTYGDNANFEIENGVNYTHMSIDGISCVKGAYCIYNNDTTAVQISQGLAIRTIGGEQSTASVAANSGNIWIKRPASGILYELSLDGSSIFDPARNGIVLRNVSNVNLANIEMESSASYACFDVDNTVLGLFWDTSVWRGCGSGISGQLFVNGLVTLGGYSLPRMARYASNLEDGTNLTTSIGVLGSVSNLTYLRAQASPAGNIVLLPSNSGTLVATASAPCSINSTTGNLTCFPTIAQGDLLYGSAANTLSVLAKDTNATRYLSNTGSSNNPAWAQINLANGVTGTLAIGNGGTGQTTGAIVKLVVQTFCASGCTTTIAAGSDGTYTPTTGTLYAIAEMCGGGGGGGGTANSGAAAGSGGAGGGSGGYSLKLMSAATIGASKNVRIGAAGTAGSAGNNAGGAGAKTCIGTGANCATTTIADANGGGGGGGSAGSGAPTAGAGASAGTGDVVFLGNPGFGFPAISGAQGVGGAGGWPAAMGGGGAATNMTATTSTGGSAGGCSGGAGGASFNTAGSAAGGAGGAGYMKITDYVNQ